MVIFLGNTNSGDQNFLNPLIYHRDTSLYMDLKLFGATPSGRFASILSNLLVKIFHSVSRKLLKMMIYIMLGFFRQPSESVPA